MMMGRQNPLRGLLGVVVLLLVTCQAVTKKPNIVFILVDDQDLHMNSLDHMEVLQRELVQKGTLFNKHYGHVSQCCPARTTIWTGKHAHNTNITSVWNNTPGGAWKHVQEFGWYKNHIGPWLQKAGYTTYYTGKIYNGYGNSNYCKPHCVEGWSKADILVDWSTYWYYNSSYAHYDGSDWNINSGTGGYSTDEVGQHVANFISEAASTQQPFFAVAAPVAPHQPAIPKKEYSHLYPGLTIPRTPNFNPANRTGVTNVWNLEQLNETNIKILDGFYRRRQQCLKSVDDMIEVIVDQLEKSGVLDSTYIIYTSDNGYHIGQHRQQGGKDGCFEEDVNLPFIIRGPDVGAGKTSDLVTGHVDLVPTFLTLAGVDGRDKGLDGIPITFPFQTQADYDRNAQSRGESIHLEMWSPFLQEGYFGNVGVDVDHNVQIYKALRLQGADYNLMYSVWCQQAAHELYDMTWDPYQMTNLHPSAPVDGNVANAYQKGMKTFLGRPTEVVIHRLDALVLVQKTCAGDVCREPWKQLHPSGHVTTLTQALNASYDAFYAHSYEVAKVGWQQCYTGLNMTSSSTLYSLANEYPLWLDSSVRHKVGNEGQRLSVQSLSSRWLLASVLAIQFLFLLG